MSELQKEAAGRRAAELVKPGMIVGLGSGSTVRYFLEALAGAEILGVPTSEATAAMARAHRIPVTDEPSRPIDLAVDGADEIDPGLNLIKGRGGALLREKLVALSAERFIVIADESKLVPRLGAGVLPVEVVPFLWRQTAARLEALGAAWAVRGGESSPFITDNGNLILDLTVAAGIADPGAYGQSLKGVAGVCEHGLFAGLAGGAIVGTATGIRLLGAV